MDVSIVIPVFNKSALTRVCLSALARTIPPVLQCEVIVVDNNSTDDTQAVLAEFPWIRTIANAENKGFAGGNNQGAAIASGKYLLLLNNDTEPQPGFLEALVRTAGEADVGVVGARLLFANRTLQHAGVVVAQERFGPYQFIPYHIFWSDAGNKPAAMVRKDYQIVTGACLFTPLALYRELGGLDELFWNGYEDVDYCFKVRERGMRVVYEPQAELFHYESQSGPLRFSRIAYNSILIARRWAGFPKIDHTQGYLAAGNVRRTSRVANKFATASMRAPKTTVLVHGSEPASDAFASRLRATLAPLARVIWTLEQPPPDFGTIPAIHALRDPVAVAREEMTVRGDRYLALIDSSTVLTPNWLDKLVEQIEWAVDVVAATTAPELPNRKEVSSLAADARCTLLALRHIPQHEHLCEGGTLNGAIADLTLRMIPYEFGVRKTEEPAADLAPLPPDAAFQARHGAPIESFLREDPAYVEDVLRHRSRRTPAELRASIVMLSWNAVQYTKIALESIRAYTKMPYEVIIVDNGSGEETTSWLREQTDITVIYNATNRGFAGGNNQGIAAATGDYIVLLNNDVIVTDGWLENLVQAAERDPATGVTAPRSNEIAGDQKLLDLQYDSIEKMHAIANQRTIDYARAGYFTDRAIGFCLCVKREVFEQVGGLDESFGAGNFEDDDLSMRIRASGYRMYVCNDVFIHHFGSVSFKANSIDYAATMQRNWEKFAAKWGYGREMPTTGYDALLAIRGGFDRGKHFFALPGMAVRASVAEEETSRKVRLLFAGIVQSEADWTIVGALVRKYLSAFGEADDVVLALACRAEIPANVAGSRIERAIEKAGIDPERCADIMVSDEEDPAAWLRGFQAERSFGVTALTQSQCDFAPLQARSPSDLRRLYDSVPSEAR